MTSTPEAPTPDNDGVPNAYSLLSRDTLSLTDAEVEIIVADLQKRRHAYVSKAVKDTPDKPKAAKTPTSAEEKRKNTEALAAAMNLDFDL